MSDFPRLESKMESKTSIVENINFGQITPGASKLSRPISSPDLRRPIIESRASAFRESPIQNALYEKIADLEV